VYEWDEAKRKANLRKHGFDFDDADTVLENPKRSDYLGGLAESGDDPKGWRSCESRWDACVGSRQAARQGLLNTAN
jgi:hypothetical protein